MSDDKVLYEIRIRVPAEKSVHELLQELKDKGYELVSFWSVTE